MKFLVGPQNTLDCQTGPKSKLALFAMPLSRLTDSLREAASIAQTPSAWSISSQEITHISYEGLHTKWDHDGSK